MTDLVGIAIIAGICLVLIIALMMVISRLYRRA